MTPRWQSPLMAVLIAFALTLVLMALAGCGPKGQRCDRPGDLKVSGGVSYVCKTGPHGNTWQ